MNLQDLSKDALIEVARLALGKVGDSARTPKPEYVRLLSEHSNQDAIASAVSLGLYNELLYEQAMRTT